MRRLLITGALLVLATPTTGLAASKTFVAALPSGEGGATITVRPTRAAAFAVTLTVPVGVRARLSLGGAGAPKGVLIDTATARCPRRGAVRVCAAAYEPLPRGRYTWTIGKPGGKAAKIRLVVRW